MDLNLEPNIWIWNLKNWN